MCRHQNIIALLMSALICLGCSGPERPYAESSMLLSEAVRARSRGELVDAARLYRQGASRAQELLDRHRDSPLAVKVVSGELQLGPLSWPELTGKILARVAVWEAATGSILATAARLTEGLEPSPAKVNFFVDTGVAMRRASMDGPGLVILRAAAETARELPGAEERAGGLVDSARGFASAGLTDEAPALLSEGLDVVMRQPEEPHIADFLESAVEVCEEMGNSPLVVGLLEEFADAAIYLE